jgi:hypothetical protein
MTECIIKKLDCEWYGCGCSFGFYNGTTVFVGLVKMGSL